MVGTLPASTIETIDRGDVRLALHCFRPSAPRAALFYVHGLQSHGGWLFETGPALVDLGVALYILDRRGSGHSGGERGDIPSSHVWIDDYAAGLQLVRNRHPDVPLTLLGQSFGGSLAAALACDPRAVHDALILCAPALGHRTARLSEDEKRAVLADRRPGPKAATRLKDEWYTPDARYLEMMRADPLMLRELTPRTNAAGLELEMLYGGDAKPRPGPSALVLPRKDRVIDLTVARAVFHRLTADAGLVVEFPADCHYIEFSPARVAYWQFLAAFATHGGFGSKG